MSAPTPRLGHHVILVECDEGEAKKAEAWLEKGMTDGMDEAINSPDVKGHPVPVEVETKVVKSWAA